MEYNDLNSYLGNLELTNTTLERNSTGTKQQNTNSNYVNTEFLDSNKFNDMSLKPKAKSKTQIENLLINRNMDLSHLNNGYNYEFANPQRLQSVNTRNNNSNYYLGIGNDSNNLNNNLSRQTNEIDYELNRNLQVHNSHRSIDNMVMDYSQFSENYKSYKNNEFSKDLDRDSLNEKISSRDNIPNISSVPSNLWEK